MATRGRKTKYDPDYHPKTIVKYALLGLTDAQLSGVLDINEATLNRWKVKYPEFCESIKKGKDEADANVVSMLYKKAIGYTQKKKIPFKLKKTVNGKGSEEEIHIVEVDEYFPPEASAQFFWLKNRQPKNWRDKTETEHSGEVKGKTTIVFSKGAKGKD